MTDRHIATGSEGAQRAASDRSGACVGHHPDGEPPDADVGYLCAKCFSRLRSSLLELPAIATWLEVNIAAGGVPGERVSGTREDPIPLRVDVLDSIGPDSRGWVKSTTTPRFLLWEDGKLIEEFVSWSEAERACREAMRSQQVTPAVIGLMFARMSKTELEGFAEHLEELARVRERWQIRPTDIGGPDQRGDDAIRGVLFNWVSTVTEQNPDFAWPDRCDLIYPLAQWLAGHLSWIVEQEWVDEFIASVRKLATEAHRLAPWRPVTMRDEDPCSTCGVRAVVLHVAESTLRCEKRFGGCGKTTVSDYLRQATA